MSAILLFLNAFLVISLCDDNEYKWPGRQVLDAWVNPCSVTSNQNKAFCDVTKSFEDRAHDLVYNEEYKLSDYAKVYQTLSGNGAGSVSELSIPGYQWWSEALHGVAGSPGVNYNGPIKNTTMFPQVITTASSFNNTLFNEIGKVISTEARAMWNNNQAGLTFWAPNINIFRDPRWGRGQETPGEDPFLNQEYARNFVRGMQDGDDKYLKVSSCCKHYADYSMENADGYSRHNFNAIVSEYDQNDTYLVAFRSCAVLGDASSVMCSYNAENGIPSCANYQILTEYLRNDWGFNGYITSDCGAVGDVQNSHHYTSTPAATINATFGAGMDLDCGGFTQGNTANAITSGGVPVTTVQASIYRATLVQMRLGMFDNPSAVPWANYGPSDVCTDYNLKLAYEASQQGIVLLKNTGNLPYVNSSIKSIALIGPNAKNTAVMEGNYHGKAPFIIDVYTGLESYVSNITYQEGIPISSQNESGFPAAINAAKEADLTIMVMGLDQSQESEGHDRSSIALPGQQLDLIQKVSSASKGDTILVILSGGCVDISDSKESSNINGIIWGGYPGMYGGQAIADVIFGAYNPTGRLTQTWYKSDYVNQVKMVDMDMRPNSTSGPYGTSPGRGYRYFPGSVVYPFGSGLSYTTFTCSDITVNDNLFTTIVTNTGKVIGGGVVLVYFVPTNGGQNGLELKRLVGYTRFDNLPANAGVAVTMEMYSQFYYNEAGKIEGKYILDGICA